MKRRKIKGFRKWKSMRSHSAKSDGSIEQAQRDAQGAFRDWWTDSYRSQSSIREAPVS